MKKISSQWMSLRSAGIIILVLASGCNEETDLTDLKSFISTSAITHITQTTATCGGKITLKEAGIISMRGVCWDTLVNPTITDNKTEDGTDSGTFISQVIGLEPGTRYHIRAYGILNNEVFYGGDSTFTTLEGVVEEYSFADSLAKIYLTFAVPDPIKEDVDIYFTDYVRLLWQLQELTTDEAICSWLDPTLPDLHKHSYNAENIFVRSFYSRLYHEIRLCNRFIAASDNLPGDIKVMNSEARFLRALAYWNAFDCFGNIPLINGNGTGMEPQVSQDEMFAFIESELKAIENDLAEPRSLYARADKASCWMLLAKLYLNARVYTGSDRYNDCIDYLNRILNSGYELNPDYKNNFLADNHLSSEIIFAIPSDPVFNSFGGMNFIIHAAVGGSLMMPSSLGIISGWSGNRSTTSFYNKFPDPSGATDKRALFFTDGQILDFTGSNQDAIFKYGPAVVKFKNITSAGAPGSDPNHADTDFPLFRLADVYLMYSECVLRGAANGSHSTALDLINALRERAYGNSSGDITSVDLTLDFIIDERGRELYWEGQRRTDLIRFGLFTGGSYVWNLKGGVPEGTQTASFYDLFPIPLDELNKNPYLIQNPGY